jgi:hypothetical protein
MKKGHSKFDEYFILNARYPIGATFIQQPALHVATPGGTCIDYPEIKQPKEHLLNTALRDAEWEFINEDNYGFKAWKRIK